MYLKSILISHLIGLVICLTIDFSHAQGNLMIYPKRLVFEGEAKSLDLTLANTGKDSVQYQISFVNYSMQEDGNFELITEPDSGQQFAENNLRIFPRTVTLAPNEAQKVKVQVFRINQLNEGEYRSHLYFRAVPKQKPLEKPTTLNSGKGISTNLEMVFGISIPVIIEVGEPKVKAGLTNLFLDKNPENPILKLTLLREGSKSAYGDLKINHIHPSGKQTEVGATKGVAVYSPMAQRHFSVSLLNDESIDYSKGKLRISYNANAGKAVKFVEEELILN